MVRLVPVCLSLNAHNDSHLIVINNRLQQFKNILHNLQRSSWNRTEIAQLAQNLVPVAGQVCSR